MSSRTRVVVITISVPVIAFAIVGGFLGKAMAREDSYQHLRIFDDVVNLIMSNYVEEANLEKVMRGAMHGLADGLDPDSAYLTPSQVRQVEANAPLAAGDVGIDLTRQYYLRVIAARDDSPAAKAGIRTGDYIRAIGETPTREMSVWEGIRALRGTPGSKVSVTVIRGNAADPHVIELVRVPVPTADVTGRIAAPGVGYVRIAAIGGTTDDRVRSQIQELTKNGATKLMIDVRRTSGGSLEHGLDLARLFVANGTLAMRESREGPKDTVAAVAGDGAITAPVVVLVDAGTSAAAELFASALAGNKRAELVGEHTIGRTAMQKLVKLPDGAGLWLSTSRYLTPSGAPLHEKGLEPTVAVDEPDVEFGQTPPQGDPVFDKALERLTATDKKAA